MKVLFREIDEVSFFQNCRKVLTLGSQTSVELEMVDLLKIISIRRCKFIRSNLRSGYVGRSNFPGGHN
jgi:hypothetical protein